jgi:hypothetical protein
MFFVCGKVARHEDARLRVGLRYPGEDGAYEADALSRL